MIGRYGKTERMTKIIPISSPPHPSRRSVSLTSDTFLRASPLPSIHFPICAAVRQRHQALRRQAPPLHSAVRSQRTEREGGLSILRYFFLAPIFCR